MFRYAVSYESLSQCDAVVKRTRKQPRNPVDKRVISVGTLKELLWLREAVLKNAGFDVLTIVNDKEALAKIEKTQCGVLLLCYSIDDHIQQELARKYRELCPAGRIVAITNEALQRPPVEADAFLYGVEGAEALIAAVLGRR